MNTELIKKALEKVGNPNVLVNLISRRVRQLNSGGGGISRPLVADTANLGVADIALREIIEEKMGWEMPEMEVVTRPVGRKRPKNWARSGNGEAPPTGPGKVTPHGNGSAELLISTR
jgi:DNA-directed RNA polymerase subunit omega